MATYVPLSQRCWVQGQDSNLWPPGYEPDELPNCSTLLYLIWLTGLVLSDTRLCYIVYKDTLQ